MADLPTNYLDDILAVSMGGKRKFKITHANGSTEEVTIEDISEYAQIGSTFGAGDINKTNQAVNEKFDSGDVVDPMLTTEEGFAADAYKTKLQFDEQNKNLGGLRFGVDGEGNGGYFKADDSFVPFKKGINNVLTFVGDLGSYTSTKKQKLLVVGTVHARGIDTAPVPKFDFTKNGTTISSIEIVVPQDAYHHGGCYHYNNVRTKIAIIDAEIGNIIGVKVTTGTQYKLRVYELT